MSELLPMPTDGDMLSGAWLRDKVFLSMAEREAAHCIDDRYGSPEPQWLIPERMVNGSTEYYPPTITDYPHYLSRWLLDPTGMAGEQKANVAPFEADILTWFALGWWYQWLDEDANGGLAPRVSNLWHEQYKTYDLFWPAVDGDPTNYHNALAKAGTSGASHGVLAAYYRDKPPSLGGTPEYEIENIHGYIFGPWMFMDLMRMLSLQKHHVIYPSTVYSDTSLVFWMNPHVPHTAMIWRRTYPAWKPGEDPQPDWTEWTKIAEVTDRRYDCAPPPPPPTEFHFGEARQYAATVRWHFTYEGVAA